MASESTTTNADSLPPIRNIVVGAVSASQRPQQQYVVVDTTFHRAVHRIQLSALSHNYSEVESAANRQKCSVIVVVKADGYGHGAIASAIFLADKIGADAFAVATLEEGIALRKALQETDAATSGSSESLDCYFNINQAQKNGGSVDHQRWQSSGSSKATADLDSVMSLATNSALSEIYGGGGKGKHKKRKNSRRAAHIRILVLGPPVGFPRCFDDYYHYNIEAMISGSEVAMALYEWVSNTDERKRLQVERAANELKQKILLEPSNQKAAMLKITPKNNAVNGGDNIAIATAKTKEGELKAGALAAGGHRDNNSRTSSSGRSSTKSSGSTPPIHRQIPSATLTNVTGSDLAKEVREILKNQKLAAETQKQQELEHQQQLQQQKVDGLYGQNPSICDSGKITPDCSIQDLNTNSTTKSTSTIASALTSAFSVGSAGHDDRRNGVLNQKSVGTTKAFVGLEEIARHSRIRQKAMASEVFHDHGGDEEDDGCSGVDRSVSGHYISKNFQSQDNDREIVENGGDASNLPTQSSKSMYSSRIPTNTNRNALPMTIQTKKRLRWHALVDSGMGRLGFKADPVSKDDQDERRDTVEIVKELVDLEVTLDCPIEFYGMCTHMADASNSTSTFTESQMNKFKSLLKRIRIAGISVPTISTDNSAALLTTNLNHFTANTKELLTQTDADSRGFVRTGGAIYGQRPSFPQLRAVSTLMASVRHVATLKEGESVGYDRTYVAPMDVRIATLTIGFADGYPRELGNGVGRVSIRGNIFPVAGNVCMDMLMVELGPAGDKCGTGAQVVVGDNAILWGPEDGEDGEGLVRLQDLAATLKTTQSALTCGLNKERVLRRYA